MVYVIWTDQALDDLRGIIDYISRSSPATAERFGLDLVAAVDRLARFPYSGQVVPEYGVEAIRELVFKGYRIIYQSTDDACHVRVVIHGSRDLQRNIDPTNWDLQ